MISFFYQTETAYRMALFRIVWGILMALHVGHELFSGSGIPRYADSLIHFSYPWFAWVAPLPEFWVGMVLWVAFLAALCITVGLLFQLSAAVFFVVYTYLFLIDISYYNNHYYLMALVSGIIIFLNMNGVLSLDAKLFKQNSKSPVWQRHFLMFHIVLVYFFGGVSKLFNPEWMSGEAMYEMLSSRTTAIGLSLDENVLHHLASGMTYGGALFDLVIGAILTYRRTFWIGAVGVLAFNLVNAITFNIGVFPFIMIASLVLFMPIKSAQISSDERTVSPLTTIVLGLYVLFQLIIPLRHLAIPGDSFWTGEGYLFSWNMKPGTKAVDATFFVRDSHSGLTYTIDPREYLSPPAYLALGKYPMVVSQFAHFLKGKAGQWFIESPEIRAEIRVSRNRGPYHLVIDPDIDVAELSYRPLARNHWIIETPETYVAK